MVSNLLIRVRALAACAPKYAINWPFTHNRDFMDSPIRKRVSVLHLALRTAPFPPPGMGSADKASKNPACGRTDRTPRRLRSKPVLWQKEVRAGSGYSLRESDARKSRPPGRDSLTAEHGNGGIYASGERRPSGTPDGLVFYRRLFRRRRQRWGRANSGKGISALARFGCEIGGKENGPAVTCQPGRHAPAPLLQVLAFASAYDC
jgi:hypothetical protein